MHATVCHVGLHPLEVSTHSLTFAMGMMMKQNGNCTRALYKVDAYVLCSLRPCPRADKCLTTNANGNGLTIDTQNKKHDVKEDRYAIPYPQNMRA